MDSTRLSWINIGTTVVVSCEHCEETAGSI
jgi:hypothetical protein